MNVNLTEAFGDGDMFAILKHILVPLVKSFSPDFILVSAGFDAGAYILIFPSHISHEINI